MLIASLFTLLLLGVCSVAPGLAVVRWFRWDAPEALCAAVASSCILIYLATFVIYVADIRPEAYALITLLGFGSVALFRRDAIRLLRDRQVKRMLGSFAMLWVWVMLLLLLIRHYAGGTWSADWLEHYHRSLFFRERQPLDTKFLDQYALTDRPPLMNLVASFYLSQVNPSFYVYEITAATLNLLPVLPVLLFAQSIFPGKRRGRTIGIAVIVVILASSPMFMENVTYVWTKSFAAFFALLGIWFYLRGWQKNDPSRLIAGFVFAAAGCLVHYSIVPSFLAMGAHYLFFVWSGRERKWREIALVIVLSGAMLMSWFGWALVTYGSSTFTSNLTVTSRAGEESIGKLTRVEKNLVATVVPYFLRHAPYSELGPENKLDWARDLAFCLYQTNAIFAFGSAGAAVLLFVLLTRRAKMPRGVRQFWMMYVPITAVLGIAVAPIAEAWGVAHLALQPLVFLGLALLIGAFERLPKTWRIVLTIGILIDFCLGVFLHVHLENRSFPLERLSANTFTIAPTTEVIGHSTQFNSYLKQYSGEFLGDGAAPAAGLIQVLACLLFLIGMLSFAISAMRGGRLVLEPPMRSAPPAAGKASQTNRRRQN